MSTTQLPVKGLNTVTPKIKGEIDRLLKGCAENFLSDEKWKAYDESDINTVSCSVEEAMIAKDQSCSCWLYISNLSTVIEVTQKLRKIWVGTDSQQAFSYVTMVYWIPKEKRLAFRIEDNQETIIHPVNSTQNQVVNDIYERCKKKNLHYRKGVRKLDENESSEVHLFLAELICKFCINDDAIATVESLRGTVRRDVQVSVTGLTNAIDIIQLSELFDSKETYLKRASLSLHPQELSLQYSFSLAPKRAYQFIDSTHSESEDIKSSKQDPIRENVY